MTTIYLVRHAEAEGNAYRRIHGQYDSLITPNGLRQIEALKKRFADVHIDACYASDLYRTRRTAQAVYVPKHLPLVTDARLREVNLGRWEDVPFGYLERFEAEDMYKFNHDERVWFVEGSERWQTYTDRFLRALAEIAREHEGQTVAIFSHGCVLRGVQKRLNRSEWVPYCDNTAVSKLILEDGVFQFAYLNDNSHLSDEISTFARQKWWRQGGGKDYNMWFRGEGVQFTAMLGAEQAGFVHLRDAPGETGWIEACGMEEGYRGRALGIQLIGQAVSCFRRLGKKRLAAAVGAENGQALCFFKKHGFAQTKSDGGVCILEKGIEVPGPEMEAPCDG